MLTTAHDLYDRLICSCGCNQWRDEAHDPATEGRWQPHVQDCYAGQARREFLDKHREDLDGRLVWLELLPEGQTVTDPLEYDPERARAEYEQLQRRHGAG